MTQCADILESAFYEAGLTTELQSATPTQTTKAMDTMTSIIKFLYGASAGEYLNAWPLGNVGRAPQYQYLPPLQVIQRVPLNAQLVATNENAITVDLPMGPSDGARFSIIDPFNNLVAAPVTVNGNGRTINGAPTITFNVNGYSAIFFYRDDLANWVRVTPLLITDEMPFPEEYDQMFIIMMAMRLNPVYGRNLSSTQTMFLKEFRQQFTARYVQAMPLQINPDISYATLQSYDQYADAWFGGGNTQTWDQGGWWGGWQ